MGIETAGRWERDLKTHLAELIARMNREEAAEKMAFLAGK